MNESLQVTSFAGIGSVQLKLNDLNLLIGPQATGKSVIAKLLFFFKGVIWQVFAAVENNLAKRELDQTLLKRFEELFPQRSWGKSGFDLIYRLDDLTIRLSKDGASKSSTQIEYSKYFHTELNRLKRILSLAQQRTQGEEEMLPSPIYTVRDALIKNVQAEYGARAAFYQLFIPAGRSFFANLQSSIFSFLSGNNALDPFLKEFGSFYENTKRSISLPRRRRTAINSFESEAEKLIQEILCGRYISENGRDFLDVVDGRRINLGNCSSGQQETLPLALMLKRLPFLRRSAGNSVYIEEPEAHLFPTAQRVILELIALTYNATKPHLQIVITTHSPYVLTAINNLLQAGSLYKKLEDADSKRLSSLVPRDRALSLETLSAYSLNREQCVSIIDADTDLLKTDLIDQVSTEMAIQFDNLLDFE